jgi:hypothetical protein
MVGYWSCLASWRRATSPSSNVLRWRSSGTPRGEDFLLRHRGRAGGRYSDWFQQILQAAAQEYGATVVITPRTIWSVPLDVRRQIEGSLAEM